MTAESAPRRQHVYLVVVDETEEVRAALRFACRVAKRSGGHVALFAMVEPVEFEHFTSIGDLMHEEARLETEQLLQRHAANTCRSSGTTAELHVREGSDRCEELLALLEEEPAISAIILGANPVGDSPGPMIEKLTGPMAGRLPVPVVVVPGSLTNDEIDSLT